MNTLKIVAIMLIVGGTLGLAYGGFSYTKETHRVDIGLLHINADEKQQVNIPLWASIGAIAGGVLLLATSRKQ
jgi:membrane associated rhomboid family serine protease